MISIKVDKSKFMPGDYSLYLSFSYNERILNIVRAFKNRSWHKDIKAWEVPISELNNILEVFADQDIDISGTYLDLSPKEEVTDIKYNFKTKPYEYQKESFLYGMNHDKWFLGDQMGLGKSKQVIDIAVALKEDRKYNHCLIICGVNGLKWNWLNEVSIHSDESAYILGQKIKKRTGEIYIGSNKDKLNDVLHLEDISSYFIITNIETMRDEKIVSALTKSIDDGLISMIAIDECHKCLGYDTPVLTNRGYFRIGEIVENKMELKVLSYNENTKNIEFSPIKDWFTNVVMQSLMKLKFQTNRGTKIITCTPDHKFLTTNRGWVMAKNLTEADDVVELEFDL